MGNVVSKQQKLANGRSKNTVIVTHDKDGGTTAGGNASIGIKGARVDDKFALKVNKDGDIRSLHAGARVEAGKKYINGQLCIDRGFLLWLNCTYTDKSLSLQQAGWV